MKNLILPFLLMLIIGAYLPAQVRLNVDGDARITGGVLELVKPSNTSHVLYLSSNGAALDITSSIDLYLNSGGNINLDANNPTGRIGIGTAGPATKLHVVGDRFRLSTPGDENRYIDLRTDGNGLDLNPVGANFYIDPGANDLILATQTGKVGIGTETPSHKLSVTGNTQIVGSLELFRTPGDSSLFIGPNTGPQDDGNNRNTFIGTNAGKVNTSGYFNTFSGYNSGFNNTSGAINTLSGYNAGFRQTTGFRNTFSGAYAGYYNTEGYQNTFLGAYAGTQNRTGSQNTFIGNRAGQSNLVGTRNTFVGFNTNTFGDSLDRAISIGYEANVNCSNCAVIGGTGTNAVSLGIATATPEKRLDVNGEAIIRDENKLMTLQSNGSNAFLTFENNGGIAGADIGYFRDADAAYFFINNSNGVFGDLVINGSNVGLGLLDPNYQLHLSTNSAAKPSSSTWTVASDKRLKKDVQPFTDGLEVLQKIEPVWYRYNGKGGLPDQERSIGIIAQEMQRIAPYTVGAFEHREAGRADKYLSFDANALFYITINAVKEQQELIDVQKSEIQSLRSEMGALKQLMEQVLAEQRAQTEGGNYVLPLEQRAGLSQNQPNPFHQQTVIRYFIPAGTEQAYLQVTSADGKVLGKVTIREAGPGQVTIQANAYPAGTYYYSLLVDDQIMETKKMVLTR